MGQMQQLSIILVLLLALLLRLPLLDGSLWLDEAAQALESARPLNQQLHIPQDFQPPLLHLLTFVSMRAGANFDLARSEWWLRTWGALLPGLLMIYASYQVSKHLFDRRLALLTSLLLATSSLHIFYSQELRPYSLPAMWALLGTWALLAHRRTGARGGGRGSWLAFVLSSIAGLYSSYLYPFFLCGQLLWLRQSGMSWRRWLLTGVVIALGFAPWLPAFLEQLQVGQALRASLPGWEEVVSLTPLWTTIMLPLKFVYGVLDLEITGFYLLSSLVLGGGLGWLLLRLWQKRAQHQEQLAPLFYFLVMPLVSAWLVSLVVPVLQAKRVLMLLPFFYMLLVYLLQSARGHYRWLKRAVWLTLLMIQVAGISAYWSEPKLQRENWRDLVSQIETDYGAGAVALFSFDAAFAPWHWYSQGKTPTLASGIYYLPELADPAAHFRPVSDYQQALVFDYLRDLTDPGDLLPATLRELGFAEIGALDYPNIGLVRIYEAVKLEERVE